MTPLARLAVTALLVGGVLSACGDEAPGRAAQPPAPGGGGRPGERPSAVPAAPGTVLGFATVLDDGDGAELCLGGVADSYPPQCGGPPLVGWDWSEHEGDFEDSGEVRWGDFAVTGTFDGTSLTPSDIVPADEFEPPDWLEGEDDTPSFDTPCPEPDGGWVVDGSKTGYEAQDAAFRTAEKQDGYAGSFIDEPRGEKRDGGPIVNIRMVGDPSRAELAIREVWGGGLCFIEAKRTRAELLAIQREVNELPGMTYSGPTDDTLELGVTYDDGTIQDWVDATYGEGVVTVIPSLQDVPDQDVPD